MASPRGRDARLQVAAAGYLKYCGKKQVEIARILGVTDPQVSKLVRQARGARFLVDAPRFQRLDLTADEVRALEDLATADTDVRSRFQSLAMAAGVEVFSTHIAAGLGPHRKTAPAQYLERFGAGIADHVGNLIRSAGSCGVSWGGTVQAVVGSLRVRSAREGSRGRRATRFIPVVGEPLGGVPTSESSSTLAQALTEIFGRSGGPPALSLGAVPALVPTEFSATEVQAVDKLIGFVRAYKLIFGKGSPLIGRLDAILTSVGPSDQPLGMAGARYLKSAGFESVRLRGLAFGDISGVLLRKTGTSPADLALLAELDRAWKGIKEEHIRKCARAATKRNRPGVIVVAAGRKKAATVVAAVERGLVNHLVIDEGLAEEADRVFRARERVAAHTADPSPGD